jgi:ankyrin repeat protein
MSGQRDRYLRTPLHYAALENDEALVRQLTAQGADVNAQDRDGFTPLHLAAQQCAVAVAKVLLEAGATVDSTDKHGNTPLWTATFNSRGQGDMIQVLRVAGADPLHQNNYGRSPLTLARMIGNHDVEQYFADLREMGTDPTP